MACPALPSSVTRRTRTEAGAFGASASSVAVAQPPADTSRRGGGVQRTVRSVFTDGLANMQSRTFFVLAH